MFSSNMWLKRPKLVDYAKARKGTSCQVGYVGRRSRTGLPSGYNSVLLVQTPQSQAPIRYARSVATISFFAPPFSWWPLFGHVNSFGPVITCPINFFADGQLARCIRDGR